MEKLFYVYEHLRNDTNEVFYVGKGSGCRAWTKSSRNKYWKSIVESCGYTVRIVAENLTERQAYDTEALIIEKKRKAGGCVANFSHGGEGQTGYKHTKETKEKIGKASIGIKNGFFGKTHSEEVKKRISNANKKRFEKGFKLAKKGRVPWNKGRTCTLEERLKLSLAHRGLPSRKKGKNLSIEQKVKISNSLKRYFENKKVSEPIKDKK